jgi:hypothetical protein
MMLASLPSDWPTERATLQRIATHVLAQARKRHDNLFDLVPSIGGFATPTVGADRERVRLSGDVLFVERASGASLSELTATTATVRIPGTSLSELCDAVGFEPDPDFSAGPDTPALGDPSTPLALLAASGAALGDWYLLGQRAIDQAVAGVDGSEATLGRLWPEHFDYGIDLLARAGVRTNLGAAAGDGSHEEPYLYVGPWGDDRPGAADYWNASFGAVLSYADVAASDDPLDRAASFLVEGISHLRGK